MNTMYKIGCKTVKLIVDYITFAIRPCIERLDIFFKSCAINSFVIIITNFVINGGQSNKRLTSSSFDSDEAVLLSLLVVCTQWLYFFSFAFQRAQWQRNFQIDL